MKLKKLYMSFTCYLTLVAFISVISIEVSSHSYLSLKKTEVASNNYNFSTDINFVFEEERDATDPLYFTFLSQHEFSLYAIASYLELPVQVFNVCRKNKKDSFFKIPLFISYRSLLI